MCVVVCVCECVHGYDAGGGNRNYVCMILPYDTMILPGMCMCVCMRVNECVHVCFCNFEVGPNG